MKNINFIIFQKLEEFESGNEFFPPKEKFQLLGDINKKQMYEFNIELIIENSIKINSKEIQENIQYKSLSIEIEMIKLEIPIIKIDNVNINILEENNSFNEFYFIINDVIENLADKGYPIFPSTKMYIYSNLLDDFILIDDKSNFIYSSSLSPLNFIKLKLKNVSNASNNKLSLDNFSDQTKNILPVNQEKKNPSKTFTSRKRKIKEIIKLLYNQRCCHSKGFINNEGKFVKYKLEEAAKNLGESPRTLNYYLKAIHKGRKTYFDFNKNKNSKISFLIKYNKINSSSNKN